jgi:hypothetical protein
MDNLKGLHELKRQTILKFKKYILAIFSLTFLVTSCSKITPSAFWTDFHNGFVTTTNSNQGPWGGQREIAWKSEINNTFKDKDLIEFADKNDWKLIDSMSFSADTLTKNTFAKLKNDDYSLQILNEFILPKIKSKNGKIFVFKTTWLNIEPGNTRETFENGFGVLNSNRTELEIFHFWGE